MKKVLRLILQSVAAASLFAGVVVTALILYLEPGLPPVSEIQNIELQVPMRIFTAEGKLIGEFGEKRRTPITYQQIPPMYVKAVTSAEDANFFEHIGIDFKALTRAAVQLVTTGHIQSGGSTITMQLAKNYYLTFDKVFTRKLEEILLAIKLEQHLSKAEIFELYTNKIFYGKRAYGAEAAANIYYGLSLSDLNLAQLAMIAGLPKAPSNYNPIANPARAMERRDWILGRMAKLGHISDQDYRTALQQPLTASLHGPVVELDAPYIAEMVRSDVISRYGADIINQGLNVTTTIKASHQARAQEAIKTGLEAYDIRHGYRGPEQQIPPLDEADQTSQWAKILNDQSEFSGHLPAIVKSITDDQATLLLKDNSVAILEWQHLKTVKRYINENRLSDPAASLSELLAVGDLIRIKRDDQDTHWQLSQLPEVQGALVSMNSHNGAIEALVGGYDFYLSNFNRALQAKRQPGSNFKPFMYTYAMEAGFTPASIINDAPVTLQDEGLDNVWRPDNASNKFYGPTPLRKALYLSRNVVSVRLMQALEVENVARFATKFGFKKEQMPEKLSLALGTLSAAPIELARAYAVFSNGGFLIEPHFIKNIKDNEGNYLEQTQAAIACNTCEQETNDQPTDLDALGFEELTTNSDKVIETLAPRVVDARSIYLIDSILQDTVKRGTATRAKRLERNDLAGKTGTTNGPTDAWFSGYNNNIVTTTWVGFDSFAPIGRSEYGGSAALPIWIDYMKHALAGSPETRRVRPSGIVSTLIDPETGLRVRAGTPGAKFEYFREDNLPEFKQTNALSTPNTNSTTIIEESSLF